MKRLELILALVGVGFLSTADYAHAIIVTGESMEWILAKADRVVVGKVVNAEKIAGVDMNKYDRVTVAISRNLKGEPANRAIFLVLFDPNDRGYARRWLDDGFTMLFCLVKNDGKEIPVRASTSEWVLRDAVLLGKSKPRKYGTGCVPVMTRDFEVLSEPERILEFVERTIKAMGKNLPESSHRLEAPVDTAVFNALWAQSTVGLIVPVDEKLEVLGRSRCRSKSDWDRKEGAEILAHFKNDENIAILKSLLDDPSNSESTSYTSTLGTNDTTITRKRVFPVRKASFESLRQLGQNVERPVLEELLEERKESRTKGQPM